MSSHVNDAHTTFGPYRVLERIGVGSMATVHRATKPGIEGFERATALKRMLPHLTGDDDFVRAFVREAKLAALLQHANIAQIFELGRVGHTYFIAMEFVEGHSVRAILRHARRTGTPPPLAMTLALSIQLCDALDYAHRRRDDATGQLLGIVHGDLSPSNLFVEHAGHLKVIDFGIARATTDRLYTEACQLRGKLGYMAPEATTGRALDARADIFAIGVLVHELLTTRPLFTAATEQETLDRLRGAGVEPPSAWNPDCPEALDTIVGRALERDRERRFGSASEMRDALVAVARSEALTTTSQRIAAWVASELADAPNGDPGGAERSRSVSAWRGPQGVVDGLDPDESWAEIVIAPDADAAAAADEAAADADDADDADDDAMTRALTPPGDRAAAITATPRAPARRPAGPPGDRQLELGAVPQYRAEAVPTAAPQPPVAPRPAPRPRRPATWARGTTPPPMTHERSAPEPEPEPEPESEPARLPAAPRGYARAAFAGALAGLLIASGAFVLHGTDDASTSVPQPTTSLALAVQPRAATVTVDGRAHASASAIALGPGRHRVTVRHPGYRAWTAELALADGQTRVRSVDLSERTDDARAKLILREGADDLTLVVDGRRLSAAPPIATLVEPGRRSIELRRGDRVVRALELEVEPHTDYEL